jgi:D,D-heptose 1,7-bisphosphate phosphatase
MRGPSLINGGVYVFRRSILDRITTAPMSLEHDVLPALAKEGRLYGRCYDRFFIDIGIPVDFARADAIMRDLWQRPALFLDRDGVLNVNKGHVYRADQVNWISGAKAAIKRFNNAGYFVFVVSNQAGVARGYYSEEDVQALHRRMAAELQAVGAHVDRFEYCPYHPDGVVPGYCRTSDRRKPGPGMLLDCFARWPIDVSRSLLIGDEEIDIAAASAAGIKGHLFFRPDLLAFVEQLFNGHRISTKSFAQIGRADGPASG